jgi:hypothetical protein
MRIRWAALSTALVLGAAAVASCERAVVFDLGPAGYSASVELFAEGAREVSVDPRARAAAVPYVLPGPADAWAGAVPHALRFRLGPPPRGGWALDLDAVETHDHAPPRLAVQVDETVVTRIQTRAGTGLPPPHENRGVRAHYRVRIPASARAGVTDLLVVNEAGSWVMWERLRLVEARRSITWTRWGLPGPPPPLSGALLAGGLAALVVGAVRRTPPRPRTAALAGLLILLLGASYAGQGRAALAPLGLWLLAAGVLLVVPPLARWAGARAMR